MKTVQDIIDLMARIAPPAYAESWDNCGLQVGSPGWPVRSVWVALDPLAETVTQAADAQADMLIVHHPLFFKPIKSIDFESDIGQVVHMAASRKLAVFTAHTNLDSAADGLNDWLAGLVGLVRCTVLSDAMDERAGLGRIGWLPAAMSLEELIARIKSVLNLPHARLVGDPAKRVDRVAVCTGSGGSLMPAFFASDAQVFITGDLGYHHARDAQACRRALIDVGHFQSEHIIVNELSCRLQRQIAEQGWDVRITACQSESDPFVWL